MQNKKKVPENIQKIITNKKNYLNKSDVEWLHQFLVSHRNTNDRDLLTGKELDRALDDIIEKKFSNFDTAEFLEEKNKNLPYLFDLMKGSELLLPKNEVVKRNPVLAERVERLKKEQEEKEYREMTQNVDTSKKHYAEDSLSYQSTFLLFLSEMLFFTCFIFFTKEFLINIL